MKFWTSNKLIVSVLLLLIFIFSLLLYFDFKKRIGTGESEIIGIIRYKEKLIQRKIDGQVVWETIDRDMPISNRDSVRTSDDSTVTIELNDKTEIEMDENSMILLDFSNQNINLDFAYGSFLAKRSELGNISDKKLNIKSGEKTIQLGKSEVKLTKIDSTNLNVKVNKGNALLKTKDGEKEIVKDQMANIQGEKVAIKPVAIKLDLPLDKSIFFTKSDLVSIQFSWEPENIAGNTSSTLEISKDYKFANKTKKIKIEKEPNIEVKLPSSNYYWRVLTQSKSNKIESSETRKISVLKEEPMKLFLPLPKAKYTYLNNLPMISFSWRINEFASSYKLEIGRDREFKVIIKSVDSVVNRIALDSIADGNYFARVTANLMQQGIESKISEPVQFSVEKKLDLESLEITSLGNQKATVTAIENEKFALNWKSSSEYIGYEVSISQDKSFAEILQTQKVSKNFLIPKKDLRKGTFFWRVRGITKDNRYSDFSQATFEVTEPVNLEIIHPVDNSEFAVQANEKIKFKWRKMDIYGVYKLEISEKSDFSSIIKSEVTSSFEIGSAGFRSGSYFARVLLVNSTTNEELLKSKPIKFTIPLLLSVPVLTHPTRAKMVDMSDSDSIQFNWELVLNAQSYNLELFQKTDKGDKLIVSKKIKSNQFLFKELDLLDEGKFKWKVTANIRTNEGTEFTSPPGLDFFAVSLRASPSSAPEIISPKKQHTDKR